MISYSLKNLLTTVTYLTTLLAQYEEVAGADANYTTTSPSFHLPAVPGVEAASSSSSSNGTSIIHGGAGVSLLRQTYKVGDEIDLKVNSITSIHTQIPKSYYDLPFCQPDGGPETMDYGIGDRMTGNQIQSSPYSIEMLKDVHCAKLCQRTLSFSDARVLNYHIANDYRNNWFVDNLPSAYSVYMMSGWHSMDYSGRFPIGFVDILSKNVYIYNHVNIILDYNQRDQGYHVVKFTVELKSIKHSFLDEYDWDGENKEGWNKTLATCNDPQRTEWTSSNLNSFQIVEANEKIIYTYDVIWKESECSWSSRWDIYLTDDNMIPAQVHWFSITNSLIGIILLSTAIARILIVNIKKEKDNTSQDGEHDGNGGDTDMERNEGVDTNDIDTSKLKTIHSDIFLPPTNPLLFCVIVGNGSQLTLTSFVTLAFGVIGYINPSRRGSLVNVILISFTVCGIVGGYVSSRLYKDFHGKREYLCTFCTAVFFPGLCFSTFSLMNWMASARGAVSVPTLEFMTLAIIWCLVSIPLVFIGAHIGYKAKPIGFSSTSKNIAGTITRPSQNLKAACAFFVAGFIGREQASQPGQNSTSCANEFSISKYPKLSVALAGVMPFGAIFVEIFFVITSIWMMPYYSTFGFLLLVFVILLISCAEISVLLVYYSLFKGDGNETQNWRWFALLSSGSVAGYIFLYSVNWFGNLGVDQGSTFWFTTILYFGCMSLISIAAFLVTGSVGFIACLFFLRTIICPLSTSNCEGVTNALA